MAEDVAVGHGERVLLVDDDRALREALVQSFELAGIAVEPFADARSALAAIDPGFAGVVVTDIRMAGMDGAELFRRVAAIDAELPVILMTGHGDVAMAVAMLQAGAFDFVAKPFASDHLIASSRRAMAMRRLVLENRRLHALATVAADGPSPLIGDSAAMRRLRDTVAQVARAEVDVLVEGETGTGKELVARLLHRASDRRMRPFVAVDCAALPDAIAEEELFGVGMGARRTEGRIAAADRGTLFLDEIDSMSLGVQGRLLRVVEEREVRGAPGEAPRIVDLRIVAAAKTDLVAAVAAGRFRADLLYRLDAVRVRVPPLRERRDDIAPLFAWFVREAAERFGRPVPAIDAAIHARLDTHDWPGNVRELRNWAQRIALGVATEPVVGDTPPPLPQRVERFEGEVIRSVLEETGGDVRTAVERLGIPRKTFYDKIARHGIELGDYRGRPA